MGDSLLSAAVVNPIFQNAAKNSFLSSFTGDDNSQTKYVDNRNVLEGVNEQQLGEMKKWASIIRIMMLAVATAMMIVGYYNFASLSSTSTFTSNFLSVYVLFFSTMICCYEIAFSAISKQIVQNFGFMYNPYGRTIFYVLVEIILFQISLYGKIVFAGLLITMLLHIYVDFRYPKFEKYLRMTHLNMDVVLQSSYSQV